MGMFSREDDYSDAMRDALDKRIAGKFIKAFSIKNARIGFNLYDVDRELDKIIKAQSSNNLGENK